MKRIVVALAALTLAQAAHAQERIQSYNSQIEIRADGSIDVTEEIKVHAEGNQIRRGIYRDFPTRYQDRAGNRVSVALQVLGVERNGVTEPWFTQKMTNGVRINTGNDDFLPVPADYTYKLHYRTTRQLGFFSDHDELYWNAIGTGWIFPIESSTVVVRLPSPVPVENLHAEGYTGSQGAKGTAYAADIPEPGVGRFRLTQPLGPYEGFTIVLTFPKGLIHQPTQSERARWLLSDNRGVLVALAGFIALILYMVRAWQRVGRDPQKGIVIARYEPRPGQTPAGLRFMEKMGYDMRCFTGDILALAVAGKLKIHKEDHRFLNDEWSLERIDGKSSAPISPGQQTLLAGLFPGGRGTLELKNTNASIVSAARSAHQKLLDDELQPKFFKRNGGKVGLAFLIALLTGIAAFASSGGFGIPFIIAIMVLAVVSMIVFGFLIKAPTLEGRALLDEIEGLKLYMKVAEKQELASMRGPDEPVLDARRYETLLPYAVALEVEDAWTSKFTAAAGAAAAAEAANNMGWYAGRGPISNLGKFSNEIGSSFNSTISSASTPPGSSSGGGGGGSSGGGGGGGGGGGR
ncbi:MAG TPA: DUF2207 domain-containing protein [Gemmatimonadaceae bacterium]|nr:DUF2207 domain-containing protein [Gemmatimonadaceae bacterium]